jgi:proteasome lid subunit RPN8/RPN11
MRQSLETGPSSQACQTWRVPECPFTIEWSTAAMEEIRAAAMEALFSVPHGGAEIGGVLWGSRSGRQVRILAARPLLCEYALGPTFTLSGKDHVRLAALLQEKLHDGSQYRLSDGWEPVGWYHSHTRSEILLSGRDVEIHNRYFPEPWHVALVVRPHAMQPMRAGFFFREANGTIHAESSYSEFSVEPASQPEVAQSAPAPVVGQVVSPPQAPSAKRSRKWLWWAMLGLAMAGATFVFKSDALRQRWTRVFAADRSSSVSLIAYDLNGQLQIRWDWTAKSIRSAETGTLEITDGETHTVIALDKQRLRGTLSYARIGGHVDVRLALHEPGGLVRQEFTTFVGHASEPQPDAPTAALRRELADQAVRTRELERAVADLRRIVRRDQKARQPDSSR